MIFLKTPLILFNSYDRRYVISPISSFLAYSHVTASGNSPPSYFLSSSFFFNSTLFSSSLGILNTKSKENKSLYSSLRPCSKTKSDTFFLLDSRNLSVSMSTSSCSGSPEFEACRDDDTALILKIVAIAAIFLAGALGVAGPLIGKKYRLLKTDSSLFFTIKAFAAGVILATGFVHMLPDATSALSNPCLPKIPWSTFPVAGFIAMMAALTTLLADFITTQYYEGKHKKQIETDKIVPDDLAFASVVVPLVVKDGGADEDGCGIHIMGVDGQNGQIHEHFDSHSHSHGFSDDSDNVARHIVVSQVLEFGIVSHSIIIGLSLGVSQSPCTIRPLLGALSFHQFFEGFALAGCISQARFGNLRSIVMACFFAITTPVSIGIGIGIASFYNPNSPRALVVEGILDSVSAGILVYMALVDLIAAEFLSKRMGSKLGHQMVSFIALYLGAGLMASLATWT